MSEKSGVVNYVYTVFSFLQSLFASDIISSFAFSNISTLGNCITPTPTKCIFMETCFFLGVIVFFTVILVSDFTTAHISRQSDQCHGLWLWLQYDKLLVSRSFVVYFYFFELYNADSMIHRVTKSQYMLYNHCHRRRFQWMKIRQVYLFLL